ncbi:hypothetical protein Vafri_7693 [Volvox africanus]|uniref:Uncharacterized protein n=1 Tax=Volvox africanus TaxID=51714 RepID=A0A8J4EZI7_9CHLO|nr:hypothetical protein Vafri_7693 [Volvox africanus]
MARPSVGADGAAICLPFPMDAAHSITDCALLAAKQSGYMSAVQIAESAVLHCILVGIAGPRKVDVFTVFATIKCTQRRLNTSCHTCMTNGPAQTNILYTRDAVG